MELTSREKSIIQLLSLKVELEKAINHNFISGQQYSEFIKNLTEDEKRIVNLFNSEREKTDIINFSMQTLLKNP